MKTIIEIFRNTTVNKFFLDLGRPQCTILEASYEV